MAESSLEDFIAYQKALLLFDHVVADADKYLRSRALERLVGQQLASADSVCSNIEEGYGRESRAEFRRFLSIARGSLRETRGRNLRLRHWLPVEVVQQRISLADEVSRILSKTLLSLKN